MYSFKTFFKLILLSETSGIFPCSKCYFSFWRFLLRCFEFLSYCVDIFVFVIWLYYTDLTDGDGQQMFYHRDVGETIKTLL